MTAADQPTLPRLDYAPRSSARKRRFNRLFLIFLVLSNLYFAVDRWGGPVRIHANLLLCQRRCLRYSQPPTRVVLDRDPVRAGYLLSKGYQGSSNGQFRHCAIYPEIESTFDAFDVVGCNLGSGRNSGVAAGWAGGADFTNQPPFEFAVFLHERRSPSGNKRLIVINAQIDQGMAGITQLYPLVIKPAWLLGRPSQVRPARAPTAFPLLVVSPPEGIRLYAGQIDPANDARFTIAYNTPGGNGFIEGSLRDDDGVSLRLVDDSFQRARLGGNRK